MAGRGQREVSRQRHRPPLPELMLLDAAKETGDWRGLARRDSRSMARHRGGAGDGGEENLARKRLGGAGLEEAEVNERGARLPRRETRPAAAALERGTTAPSGG